MSSDDPVSTIRSLGDVRADANTLSRRGFLVTTLGAGFALAVQPAAAQAVIKTDSSGLLAGEIRVPAAGGDLVAYRAMPEGGKNLPVILVISEIFGVHEYIADVCRRFARQGYLAIAPELFARYGDPRKMSSIGDIITHVVDKVPDSEVMADLDAAVVWAGKHGGDGKRLAITGFCWGGRITWLYAAHNPALTAGVAWYGRIDSAATALQPHSPLDLVDKITAPVLGLYGGADQGIPLSDVEAMRQALSSRGARSKIHVYPDAPHAFHADYRPSYRQEPATDGWQRALDWLKASGM